MAPPPWSLIAGGVNLVVRLTPKGGRDAIDGVEIMSDGRAALKIRVQAPASKGEANVALIKLVAKAVGIPSRDVSLAAGAPARTKRLVISGDGPTLVAALEKIAAPR
jgi:hypothetical protein